ncbi:MAG: hypothetical protein KF691_12180 [Phycisphaeraceae bacterium]|nr:hypothetical protein [Phycisphaeraceae bacterium]
MKFHAFLSAVASSTTAVGASISYMGQFDQDGTGFGSVLSVLALQANGSESGGVAWNGSADVRSGDAKPFSQTRSIAEIVSAGANLSQLAVVLNIAQPGSHPDITLRQFSVVFYSAAGVELFSADFSTPMLLTQINSGVGGAGHLFAVNLSDDERSQLSDSVRIGIRVIDPIDGSQGAPESFYLVPSAGSLAPLSMAASILLRRRKL